MWEIEREITSVRAGITTVIAIFRTNTCENSKAKIKQYSNHLKGFDDIDVIV